MSDEKEDNVNQKNWRKDVSSLDGQNGIDLSDELNSIQELRAILEEVSPELLELINDDLDTLFDSLKTERDGQFVVKVDTLISFLSMIDENADGITSEEEITNILGLKKGQQLSEEALDKISKNLK